MKHTHQQTGFTLIEILVSVAVFSVVMMVAVGGLLTISEANRKAQALQAITTNLNFALEGVSRTARVGGVYRCQQSTNINKNTIDVARNCNTDGSPGSLFAFEPFGGIEDDPDDQVVYMLNGTRLERSIKGGDDFLPITSEDVVITAFDVHVEGAPKGDQEQPRVILILRGTTSFSPRSTTEFNLQTSFTQRALDL